MNDKILSIFFERGDLNVSEEEKNILRKFFHYADVNSLFLRSYEPGDDPKFTASDDAVSYTFSLSQIKNLWAGLKSGRPLDWQALPHTYIGKGAGE